MNYIKHTIFALFVLLFFVWITAFTPRHTFAAGNYGDGNYGEGNYGTGDTGSNSNTNNGSNSNNISNGGSTNNSSTCTAQVPIAAPDLFEIDVKGTNATLFLAPPPQPYTNYQISFGDGIKDEGYNVTFPVWNVTGAIAYTIHYLQQTAQYSFKVRVLNNCMPGKWSGDITIVSDTTKGVTIKKYYPSQKPILAYVPNKKVTQFIANPSITYAPGKPQTFVPTPLPTVKATAKTTAAVKSSGSIWDTIKNFFSHLF